MRFVSWNIQGGKNLQGVGDVLEELSPDIIALQEVKSQDSANSAHLLAKRLGYNSLFFPAFTTERHSPSYTLGNGVLSRLPVLSSKLLTLSTLGEYEGSSATEPRTAGVVQVQTAAGPLYAVTAHVAYSTNLDRSTPRDAQVSRLLDSTRDLTPATIGIDLNSLPDSYALDIMTKHFTNTDKDNTIPTWTNTKTDFSQHRIDYVFRTEDVLQNDFQIIDTDASDHRPLVLDFDLVA